MTTRQSPNGTDNIINELVKILGPDIVLTSTEDRYVYSHKGAFGMNRTDMPIAVLRADVIPEKLMKRVAGLGVHIVASSEAQADCLQEGKPYVILDDQEPLNAKALLMKLEEHDEEGEKARHILRGSIPFNRWFTEYIKAGEGFRVGERSEEEKDFCVVQRFFGGVETHSAKGRLLVSKGLLNGELEASDKVVDILYSCTSCGQCYDQLGEGTLEINNAIVRARKEIVENGMGPRHCRVALENIRGEGNPMGMPGDDRAIWWEEIEERFGYARNEVLYWPGCTTSYRLPETVEATVEVMEKANVDIGLLGENETCCGLVLYLNGQWDEAKANAQSVIDEFDPAMKTLVTNCAGCFYAFSRVFTKLGIPPRFNVLHTSQLFDELIREGRLSLGGIEGRVAWHDPCDLGRHCGIYGAPRRVLEAVPGLEVAHSPLSGEHTLCCGGGGGLMAFDIELAEKVAAQKLEEDLAPLKAGSIVTGCPACILNLRSATREGHLGLDVIDLSELLVKAL
jgi:Fe-S oxidoreductase